MSAPPLVVSFARFEDLNAAREQLLAAGVPPEAVQWRSIDDEAGPVEGNFVSGNGRMAPGGAATADVKTGGAVDYARNFERTAERGAHVMTVAVADETQRAHALRLLARFGALDVEAARAPG